MVRHRGRVSTGQSRYRCQGFTLLEVIVAMVVLTIGITGALAAISACLRNCESASEYSRGAFIAQQVIAQMDRETSLDAGTQTGTFDDLDASANAQTDGTTSQATSANSLTTQYNWTAVISDANEEGLYPVTVTVQWDNGNKQWAVNAMLRPHSLQTTTALPTNNSSGTGTGTSPGNNGGTPSSTSNSSPTSGGGG